MWLLTFFPYILIHLTVATGMLMFLVATFLGAIPGIKAYKTPIQIAGMLILIVGVYLEGGLSYKEKVDKQVLELENKLAIATVESERLNQELQTSLTKGNTVIRERGQTVIKYLESPEGKQYDSQCVIPNDIINAHNQAATLSESPPVVSSDIKLPPRTDK